MDYYDAPTKTCVLKVNIQCCKACPRKVKKQLQKIDGVYSIAIDSNQGKVTISGPVDPMKLIEMFAKLGKKAELESFQKDPMNDHNHLDYKFRKMKIGPSKAYYKGKKYIEHGGIDQHCCCDHDDEYDHAHNNVHNMNLIMGNDHVPQWHNGMVTFHHPHHHVNVHAIDTKRGSARFSKRGGGRWMSGQFPAAPLYRAMPKYPVASPYYQRYGEEMTDDQHCARRSHSVQPVMYDRPAPPYNYFQPRQPVMYDRPLPAYNYFQPRPAPMPSNVRWANMPRSTFGSSRKDHIIY